MRRKKICPFTRSQRLQCYLNKYVKLKYITTIIKNIIKCKVSIMSKNIQLKKVVKKSKCNDHGSQKYYICF